jgi:histidinol-phosphatase (PHP family)
LAKDIRKMNARTLWKVSLHGGHTGTYCEHATGTLAEAIEKAIAFGYDTFGFSEHAPRLGEHLLYDEEAEMGWDVAKLQDDFQAYATDLPPLIEQYADKIHILRGFECEVVPDDQYVEIMSDLKERHSFDYMVGSVHHIHEIPLDGPAELFEKILTQFGGDIEALAIHYYQAVGAMIQNLKPDVVAHLDLIKKNAPEVELVDTTEIRKAIENTLEVAHLNDCILDCNTAGIRKNLGGPYPAQWIVEKAHSMGIPFCFGDDSHSADQVGAGIVEARKYLMELGVDSITGLRKIDAVITKTKIPLD